MNQITIWIQTIFCSEFQTPMRSTPWPRCASRLEVGYYCRNALPIDPSVNNSVSDLMSVASRRKRTLGATMIWRNRRENVAEIMIIGDRSQKDIGCSKKHEQICWNNVRPVILPTTG